MLLLLIAGAGLTTLGASEPHEEEAAGFVPPKGPPVATVTVDALVTLKFQDDNFDTVAGINQIDYVNQGGVHTLVFEEKEFNGFNSKSTPTSRPTPARLIWPRVRTRSTAPSPATAPRVWKATVTVS